MAEGSIKKIEKKSFSCFWPTYEFNPEHPMFVLATRSVDTGEKEFEEVLREVKERKYRITRYIKEMVFTDDDVLMEVYVICIGESSSENRFCMYQAGEEKWLTLALGKEEDMWIKKPSELHYMSYLKSMLGKLGGIWASDHR